jgi:hypothetical protein
MREIVLIRIDGSPGLADHARMCRKDAEVIDETPGSVQAD